MINLHVRPLCDLLLESGTGAVYCGLQRVQKLINSRVVCMLHRAIFGSWRNNDYCNGSK